MHTHVHGQQPKCPSTLEWIDTLACSYNGTAYRMKMNEIHYIQQCRHISKYWLKETGLERGYKTSFWDRANDLFCILGRGYTRIQFVTVHENVHISGVQFSVYILYVFNFTHKKWKKKKGWRLPLLTKTEYQESNIPSHLKQQRFLKQRFSRK